MVVAFKYDGWIRTRRPAIEQLSTIYLPVSNARLWPIAA